MKKYSYDSKDYFNQYLRNYSLKNLPGERWRAIQGFDNFEVSSFGRIKSLERWTDMPQGRQRKEPELIMKPFLNQSFNKYLNKTFYHLLCRLSLNGHKYRISIPRLVYYHFVKKFELKDHSVIISFKDGNSLHPHYSNLELLSISDQKYKMFRNDRARSWKSDHKQAISQYSIDGEFIKSYEGIQEAERETGISNANIYVAVHKESLTAGGFRWFLADYKPTKKDFKVVAGNKTMTKNQVLNLALWKKLGRPSVDPLHPPACLNISLKNLLGEKWKPVPGFESLYEISNKGRIKKKAGWSLNTKKVFWGEQIMGLRYDGTTKKYLSVTLSRDKTKFQIAINRLIYCSFVKGFDLSDHALVIDDTNASLLNISPSKLHLRSLSSVLREKRIKK